MPGGGFGKGQALVSIDPERGTIEPHDRSCCELAFAPPSKMTLKGCEIMLNVSPMNTFIGKWGEGGEGGYKLEGLKLKLIDSEDSPWIRVLCLNMTLLWYSSHC